MKTRLLTIALIACIVAAGITSCNFTTEQKAATLETVKANVEAASVDMEIARHDSTEIAKYKDETEIKLRENELLIADMKDRMRTERQESLIRYEKQLDSLNQRNSKLRNNFKMFSNEGKANWENFKKGFNQELDELGKAISQMAELNSKKG